MQYWERSSHFTFIQAKKEKVRNLREMNTDAEKVKSFGEFITEDFQRR